MEAAAKAAGQKLAPYIADAVRSRMQREGMLPGSQEADALAEARDLIAVIGPVEFRRLITLTRERRGDVFRHNPCESNRRADRGE